MLPMLPSKPFSSFTREDILTFCSTNNIEIDRKQNTGYLLSRLQIVLFENLYRQLSVSQVKNVMDSFNLKERSNKRKKGKLLKFYQHNPSLQLPILEKMTSRAELNRSTSSYPAEIGLCHLRNSLQEPVLLLRLQNDGTDCFVNSFLNPFLNLPSIRHLLMSSNCKGPVFTELKRIYNWKSTFPYSTQMLRLIIGQTFQKLGHIINLADNNQHDVSEFALSMFDSLKYELEVDGLCLDPLHDFTLQIRKTIICMTCGTTRNQTVPCQIFTIPATVKTMKEGIQNELSDELINVTCNNEGCQSQTARLVNTITKFPKVLCVQYMRFSSSARKIDCDITTPTKLNLCNSHEYHLSSSIVHIGNFLSSGHYISHIWDTKEAKFWTCNDTIVTPNSSSSPNLGQTYMVFYVLSGNEQVDVPHSGGDTRQAPMIPNNVEVDCTESKRKRYDSKQSQDSEDSNFDLPTPEYVPLFPDNSTEINLPSSACVPPEVNSSNCLV